MFEPQTIHKPYLFSAQYILTNSVVTRVLHVIITMHSPQPACQVKAAQWTPRTRCAYFAFFSFFLIFFSPFFLSLYVSLYVSPFPPFLHVFSPFLHFLSFSPLFNTCFSLFFSPVFSLFSALCFLSSSLRLDTSEEWDDTDSHSVVPWLCTVDTWVPWSRVVCLLSFSWQGTLREVESLTAALSQQVRSQP